MVFNNRYWKIYWITSFIILLILGHHFVDARENVKLSNELFKSDNGIPLKYKSNSNAIVFNGNNFHSISLLTDKSFDRSKYNGIRFLTSSEVELANPSISIRLIKSDHTFGPSMELVSKTEPDVTATGLKELPQRWTHAYLPLPEEGEQYLGINIISKVAKEEGSVYFDKFELMAGHPIHKAANRNIGKPAHNKMVESQPSILLNAGMTYTVSAPIADPSLGGQFSGRTWYISQDLNMLNGFRIWNMENGLLKVLSNGNLLLTGKVFPIVETSSSCKTWDANVEFYSVNPSGEYMKELNPNAYVENGGKIDSGTWRSYLPVYNNSYWNGTSCNLGKKVVFNGVSNHMAMQIGVGANGKNGNLGMAVWLTFIGENGQTNSLPLDFNCDLTPVQSTSTSGGSNLCSDMKCPNGYHCLIQNGVATCIPSSSSSTSTSGSSTSGSCKSDPDCGWGYWCDVYNGVCKPWSSSGPTSTSGNPTTGSSCNDYRCQNGFHCEMLNNVATCVPNNPTSGSSTSGSSSTTIAPSTTSTGCQCGENMFCPLYHYCALINGVPSCVPFGQTSTTGGQCHRDSDCQWGYWCEKRSGQCHPGSTSTTGSQCHRDSDCKWGYSCDKKSGQCHPSSTTSGRCLKDSECPKGYSCNLRSGLCYPETTSTTSGKCRKDSECPRGYTCDQRSGLCYPETTSTTGGQCYRDSDCPNGYWCEEKSGLCYPRTSSTTGGQCYRDSDCPNGYWCEEKSGLCYPGTTTTTGGQCLRDSDCQWGYWCDVRNGQCYPGTTSTTGGNRCGLYECPFGYTCRNLNGVDTCVPGQPTTSPPTTGGQCIRDADCQWGYWCDLLTGQCQPSTTSPTTAPPTSTTGGNRCGQYECPYGYYCRNLNGVDTCVPSQPTTTSQTTYSSTTYSPTSTTGGNQCGNYQCPYGYYCNYINGVATCVPGQTTSPTSSQPTTYSPTSSTGSQCGNYQCPYGYYCNNINGVATCVPNNPTTTGSTTSQPTTSTSGQQCGNYQCPYGYYCDNINGVATCVPNNPTTSQPTSTTGQQCGNYQCPYGYYCNNINGVATCVPNNPTTSQPTSTTGQQCGNYQCPYGYYCNNINGVATCVPNNPTTTGPTTSQPTSTTGQQCGNYQCPYGYYCNNINGVATCVPNNPTTSQPTTSQPTSTTGQQCGNYQCPYGYYCSYLNGVATCIPINPTTGPTTSQPTTSTTGGQCRNYQCPYGYYCDDSNGVATCIPINPTTGPTTSPPTTGGVCDNYQCPFGYYCENFSGVAYCLPINPTTGQTTSPTTGRPCTDYITIVRFGVMFWNDTISPNGQYESEIGENLGPSNVIMTLVNLDYSRAVDVNGNEVPSLLSSEQGPVYFENLKPGDYYILYSNLPLGYSFTTPIILDPLSESFAFANSTSPVVVLKGPFSKLSFQVTEDCKVISDTGILNVGVVKGPVNGTNAFGHVVYVDNDKDGKYTPNIDTPVENAIVTLYNGDCTTPASDAYGNPVAQVLTNAKGEYYFDNLNPGDYCVEVSNTPNNLTFSNSTTGPSITPSSGKTPKFPVGPDVPGFIPNDGSYPVNGTSINPDINFPLVPAEQTPTFGLGHRVFHDVDNDGYFGTNDIPLPGVTVNLLKDCTTPVATTSTDAYGEYFFNNVANGTYCIEVVDYPKPLYHGNGHDQAVIIPGTNRTLPFEVDVGETGFKPNDASVPGLTSDIINPNLNFPLIPDIPNFSVGHKTFEDINNDGVFTPGTDIPLPNVTVTLLKADCLTPMTDANGAPVAPVVTDANGEYSFNNLDAGDACMVVDQYPPIYSHGNGVGQAAIVPGTDKTLPFTIGPNSPGFSQNDGSIPTLTGDFSNPNLNFPFVKVPTFGIGHLVFEDKNKNGIFDGNDTVTPNVVVNLLEDDCQTPATNGFVTIPPQMTDASGQYYFNNIPAGNYCISLSNIPNGLMHGSGKDFAAIINGTDITNIFTVGPNAPGFGPNNGSVPGLTSNITNPEFNFPLVKSTNNTFAIGDTIWYDYNQNAIQDPGEIGIPRISVTLYDVNGNIAVDSQGNRFPPAITDANGKYYFDMVPPGIYSINFAYPDQFVVTDPTIQLVSKFTRPFEVGDQDPGMVPTNTTLFPNIKATNINPNYDLPLFRPSFSLGRLAWIDINRDGIAQPNEPRVPGVAAVLFLTNGNPVRDIFNLPVPVQTTDTNGIYFYDLLPPGEYTVSFINAVGQPLGRTTQTLGFLNDVSLANEMTGVTPSIDLAKVSKPIIDFGGKAIISKNGFPDANIGFVTADTYSVGDFIWYDLNQNGLIDPDEPGVPGVTAQIFSTNNTIPTGSNGQPIGPVKTDANGYYLITGLFPGLYRIVFSTLPDGYTWTTPFAAAGQLNEFDSRVLPSSNSTNLFLLTNQNPEVRLTSVLDKSPDTYINTFQDAGIINTTRPIEKFAIGRYVWFDPDESGTRQPTENGVANIEVRLLDVNGLPALDYNGNPIPNTVTDSNGYYFIDNLAPGRYQVGFRNIPPGYNFEDPHADTKPDPITRNTPIFTLDNTTALYNNQDPPGLVANRIDRTQNGALRIAIPYGFGDFVFYTDEITGLQMGVPNVTVTLLTSTGQTVIDNAGRPVTPIKTDSNGLYHFDNLPRGSYMVTWTDIPPGFTYKDPESGLKRFILNNNTPTIRPTRISDNAPLSVWFDPTIDQELGTPSRYALGDFTWYDSNDNGIQDVNEQPASGVVVSLLNRNLQPATDIFGQLIPDQVTDGNGKYFFDKIPPGIYVVEFSNITGFKFTIPFAGSPTTSSSALFSGMTNPITLSPSTPNMILPPAGLQADLFLPTIDAGYVTSTTPTTAFSVGYLTFFDRNDDGIYDPTGANDLPVPDVKVVLQYPGGGQVVDVNGNVIQPVFSDAEGKYKFDNIPPGSYQIAFSNIPMNLMIGNKTAPNTGTGVTNIFTLSETAPQVRPSKATDGVQAPFIDDTENAGMIPLIEMAIGNYVWYDTNANGLQDSGEPPIAGATLVLIDASNNVYQQTLTNNSGYYYFDKVRPGQYDIMISSPITVLRETRYAAGNGTNDSKVQNGLINDIFVAPFTPNIRPVDPALGDPALDAKFIDDREDAGYLIPPLYSIGDFVWYDTNRNGIVETGEKPFPGMTVELHYMTEPNGPIINNAYGQPAVAVTDQNGKYWIDSILPGTYIAVFKGIPANFSFGPLGGDNVANQQGISGNFNLTNTNPNIALVNRGIDQGIINATYILRTVDAGIVTPPLNQTIQAISGFVYYDTNKNGAMDQGENPVAGVRVSLRDGNNNTVTLSNGTAVQPVLTDSTGYYSFDDLPYGTYNIYFEGSPIGYTYLVPSPSSPTQSQIVGANLGESANLPDVNPAIDKNIVLANKILRDQNRGIIPVDRYAVGDQVIYNPHGVTAYNYQGQGITVSITSNGLPVLDIFGKVINSTVTNGTGFYYFDNLPAGDYIITFSNLADQYVYEDYRTSSLANMRERSYSIPFSLNKTTTPNPADQSAYPGIRADFMRTDIDGRVSPLVLAIGDVTFLNSPAGVHGTQIPFAAMPNIQVKLLSDTLQSVTNAFGQPVSSVISDAGGKYMFTGLLPGNYIVNFSLPSGYTYTTQYAGNNTALDSNTNPASGNTDIVNLSLFDPSLTVNPSLTTRDQFLASDITIDSGYDQNTPTGFISGISFVDYNADGLFNGLDRIYPNITVSLYDGDTVLRTVQTDERGSYYFGDLIEGKQYQVIFYNLPANYYATMLVANSEGSLLQFPTASRTDVNAGILIPFEFCQDNPNVGVTCFVKDPPSDPSKFATEPVFITFAYNASTSAAGDVNGAKKPLVLYPTINTVYGVAFDRSVGNWYLSTFYKTGTKTRNSGAIYKVLPDGTTSQYVDVNTLLGSNYNLVGYPLEPNSEYRIMFGDIDIAGDFLYVTVLNNLKLLKIPLRTTPTAANIQQFTLPNPCDTPADWAIQGIGFDGANVHVGGTCTGQVSQSLDDLWFYIYRLENDNSFTNVLEGSMIYPRGSLQCRLFRGAPTANCRSAVWVPWVQYTTGVVNYTPNPIVADIEFIGYQGNMVIAFKDRNAEFSTIPAGDQLYACKNDAGKYILEKQGNCGNLVGAHTGPSGIQKVPEGPGFGEFFDDNFANLDWAHDETAWGNVAHLPGSNEVLGTAYDLFDVNEGIVHHYSTINGTKTRSFRIIPNIPQMNQYGKLNALGDIELDCRNPPTYIGNYVWNDVDRNGLQSNLETGVAGIPVTIYLGGQEVLTTTTNSQGYWSLLVQPNTTYTVKFGPLPAGWVFSPANQKSNQPQNPYDMNSKVDATGSFTYTTGPTGSVYLSIDAGIYQP